MYALLTRSPVAIHPKVMLPLGLHVLGLPLAFILSQDQTLHSEKSVSISPKGMAVCLNGNIFLF
jgi:hypothetical protein